MKKSILFTLAIAAAFTAKASLVDWQYQITKQSTADVPGYTAYLVDAATWEGMVDSKPDQAAIGAAALDSATFMSNGFTGKSGNYKYDFSTKNADNLAGARPVDVGSAASVDAYIVLFDPATSSFQASSKMTLTSRGESDGAGTSGVLSNTAATVAGGTWTQSAIPEPTTVALLALGLAALGLKRKVA